MYCMCSTKELYLGTNTLYLVTSVTLCFYLTYKHENLLTRPGL